MTTNSIRGPSILLLFGAVLVAFVANRGFKGEFSEYWEAAENRFLVDTEALDVAWEQYCSEVEAAVSTIEEGQYLRGAALLNKQFRGFEWIIDNRAGVSLSDGRTLRQAHRRMRFEIRNRLEVVYLNSRTQVAQGALRPQAMRTFLNVVPFSYQNRLAIRWKRELPEIEAMRADEASKWIFVSVRGDIRNPDPYERTIREWLRANMSELDEYKLVLGAPIGELDETAALRHIAITMRGDFVWYQFEESIGLPGSREVYETLRLESQVLSNGNSMLETSWDEMKPLVAHAEAPENIYFNFEREYAPDFEPFIRKQREALIAALSKALASWPSLSLDIRDSGEMATASK